MREEGLSVFNGYLDKVRFATGRFAVVTMWHVLEHVTDPRRILQEVRRILKPGGILVFCVPNIASPNARLLGPLWSGFDTPRHSSVFSEMGIKVMAADADFSIIDSCCFFGGFDAMNYDFRFYLEEKLSDGPVRRACLSMLASLPMRLLLFPPLFVLDRLGRGSVITYFFRKKGGS
jgi:ubiquinone/menaquinone biosynthesis C-methylase UbiE